MEAAETGELFGQRIRPEERVFYIFSSGVMDRGLQSITGEVKLTGVMEDVQKMHLFPAANELLHLPKSNPVILQTIFRNIFEISQSDGGAAIHKASSIVKIRQPETPVSV